MKNKSNKNYSTKQSKKLSSVEKLRIILIEKRRLIGQYHKAYQHIPTQSSVTNFVIRPNGHNGAVGTEKDPF